MLAIEPRKLMRGVWLTGAHLRECSRRDPARLALSAGSSSSLPCLRFIHVHVAGCPSSSEVSLFSSSLSSPSESVERSSVEQYSSPLSLSSPLTESGGLRNVRCPMYLGSSLSTGLLRPDRVVARCVLGGHGGALLSIFGVAGGAQLSFRGCNLRRLGGASRSRGGMFRPRRCRRRYHPPARR